MHDISLLKQIGCFNHCVVTLVTDKVKNIGKVIMRYLHAKPYLTTSIRTTIEEPYLTTRILR